MKIVNRALIPEVEGNYILNVLENTVHDKVFIAKSINEENMSEFFREITEKEKQKIEEQAECI